MHYSVLSIILVFVIISIVHTFWNKHETHSETSMRFMRERHDFKELFPSRSHVTSKQLILFQWVMPLSRPTSHYYHFSISRLDAERNCNFTFFIWLITCCFYLLPHHRHQRYIPEMSTNSGRHEVITNKRRCKYLLALILSQYHASLYSKSSIDAQLYFNVKVFGNFVYKRL